MKKTLTLALVAFACSCFATGERARSRSCDSDIPFDFPVDRSVAGVSKLRFIVQFPSSSGEFWFTNTSSKPVVSVLAVVELRDREGRYMFNMLFHAYRFKGHKWAPSASSPEHQAEKAIQFDQPLMPGKKTIWSMSSPFFVASCPSSARASFIQIQFSDDTAVEQADPDTRREPVVMDASTIDLRDAPFSPPFEVLATLEIDAHGHPSVIDVGSAPPQFKQWLGSRVEKWEVAPAYFGTTPVPGKLQILFRFHKDTPRRYPALANLPDASVFEVADVFPPEPGRWLYRVFLGLSTVSIRGIPDK